MSSMVSAGCIGCPLKALTVPLSSLNDSLRRGSPESLSSQRPQPVFSLTEFQPSSCLSVLQRPSGTSDRFLALVFFPHTQFPPDLCPTS